MAFHKLTAWGTGPRASITSKGYSPSEPLPLVEHLNMQVKVQLTFLVADIPIFGLSCLMLSSAGHFEIFPHLKTNLFLLFGLRYLLYVTSTFIHAKTYKVARLGSLEDSLGDNYRSSNFPTLGVSVQEIAWVRGPKGSGLIFSEYFPEISRAPHLEPRFARAGEPS